MIEIIPNENKETLVEKMAHQITIDELKLPRNFRQIGNPDGKTRIYVEDYVYTYLHQHGRREEEQRLCILVGQIVKAEAAGIYYISGALELSGVDYVQEVPILTEEHRSRICSEIKKHFDGKILLGWYLGRKGHPPVLSPELERVHKRFFGGRGKVLLLEDPLEKDEEIYVDEEAAVRRYSGYYVYYERNEQMQEYMITSRLNETAADAEAKTGTEEVVDEALKSYRELVLRKEADKTHKWTGLLYLTSFLVVFAFCLVGVSMLNNYEQMQNLENAIASLTGPSEPKGEAGNDSNASQEAISLDTEYNSEIVVETVNSSLKPLSDDAANVTAPPTEATDTSAIATSAIDTSVTDAAATDGSATDTSATGAAATDSSATDASATDTPTQGNDTAQTSQTLTEAETILLQGYYIVEKGENLAQISQKIYGTPDKMQAIIDANGIEDSDKIYAGQKLTLPQ